MKKLAFVLLALFFGKTIYSQGDNSILSEIKLLLDKDEEKAFQLIDSLIQIDNKSDYFFVENNRLCEKPKLDDSVIEYYKMKLLKDSLLFDCNSIVGRHYFNLGVEILGTEREPPLDNYEAINEKGVYYLRKAFPFIEKAYQLNPDNKDIFNVLLILYYRFGMTDQYEELKNKK